MANEHILVVDDEPDIRAVIIRQLERAGYDVHGAATAEDALAMTSGVQLFVVDMKLPGMDGLELAEKLARIAPNAPVIMISAFGEIRDVVRAMKAGVKEFMTKPHDQDDLLETVGDVLDRWVRPPVEHVAPSMTRVAEMVRSVAKMKRMTVLLLGETGVGKEVTARRIHDASGRKGEFVAVNLAELPDELATSELFGHEKGSFTGATSQRRGIVELAEGGTILLDEIGEWSTTLQVKLLRFLETKQFTRLGGEKTLKADVRIIVATNRNLRTEVDEKRFRQDIYYRINEIEIAIPPLRARQDEIPRLVRTFCRQMWEENDLDASFTHEAIGRLCAHPWPGNVRELRNVVRRAIATKGGGTIDDIDVRDALTAPSDEQPTAGHTLEAILDRATKDAIRNTLTRTKDNRAESARQLAISRRHLYNLMGKLGLR